MAHAAGAIAVEQNSFDFAVGLDLAAGLANDGDQPVAQNLRAAANEPVRRPPVEDAGELRVEMVFGLTAHEQLTCGCHVHVGISGDEEGVAVLDRIGPGLPSCWR